MIYYIYKDMYKLLLCISEMVFILITQKISMKI